VRIVGLDLSTKRVGFAAADGELFSISAHAGARRAYQQLPRWETDITQITRFDQHPVILARVEELAKFVIDYNNGPGSWEKANDDTRAVARADAARLLPLLDAARRGDPPPPLDDDRRGVVHTAPEPEPGEPS